MRGPEYLGCHLWGDDPPHPPSAEHASSLAGARSGASSALRPPGRSPGGSRPCARGQPPVLRSRRRTTPWLSPMRRRTTPWLSPLRRGQPRGFHPCVGEQFPWLPPVCRRGTPVVHAAREGNLDGSPPRVRRPPFGSPPCSGQPAARQRARRQPLAHRHARGQPRWLTAARTQAPLGSPLCSVAIPASASARTQATFGSPPRSGAIPSSPPRVRRQPRARRRTGASPVGSPPRGRLSRLTAIRLQPALALPPCGGDARSFAVADNVLSAPPYGCGQPWAHRRAKATPGRRHADDVPGSPPCGCRQPWVHAALG